MNLIKKFLKDEDGLSMVEYALIGGLIVVVGAIVVGEIGTAAKTNLTELRDAL